MWFNKKKEEVEVTPVVQCDHEECAECHHLIAKGSGQHVITIELYCMFGVYYPKDAETIYCDLHKKPYDRCTSHAYAEFFKEPRKFEKRVEPWKRVNEDGSDYVEPTSKKK